MKFRFKSTHSPNLTLSALKNTFYGTKNYLKLIAFQVITFWLVTNGWDLKLHIFTKMVASCSIRLMTPLHSIAGWRIRFYHSIDHKQQAERRLLCQTYCENDHVDLCDINDVVRRLSRQNEAATTPVSAVQLKNLNRMLWRYLPMLDPQVFCRTLLSTKHNLTEKEYRFLHLDFLFPVWP